MHVAIVHKAYIEPILAGDKTIEARLTLHRRPPWGRVATGDTLHFKRSGGPYFAIAKAGVVRSVPLESPGHVRALQDEFGSKIRAEDDFWHSRQHAKYATLVEILCIVATDQGPSLEALSGGQRRSAWHVMAPSPPRRPTGDASSPTES